MMVEKRFEAHYSKHPAWMFLLMAVIIPVALILSVIYWPDSFLGGRIVISIGFAAVMTVMFIITIRKDGIDIEVTDRTLILHKRTLIEIPLADIIQVTMNDGNGSFDMTVKTKDGKHSMHCFIKEQRKKKDQLMTLLKNEGISLITFDYSTD